MYHHHHRRCHNSNNNMTMMRRPINTDVWMNLSALIKNVAVVFIDDYFTPAPYVGQLQLRPSLSKVRLLSDMLYNRSVSLGLLDRCRTLPPIQPRESLQGYIKRTIINSYDRNEMLAKLLVYAANVLQDKPILFVEHFCNTMAECLMLNAPDTAEWLYQRFFY